MDFAVLLAQLSPDTDVRAWAAEQFEVMQKQLTQRNVELHAAKLKIEAITLEIAHLRRMRFASTSESIGLRHYDLFDETVGADVAALEAEIDGLMGSEATSGAALLPHLNVPTAPMTLSRYKVDIGDTVSLHVHTGKSEYWLILSGEGVAHVGDAEFAVSEGDVIVTPPHVPHALRNIGSVVLDFLNLVHPVDGEAITTRELAA